MFLSGCARILCFGLMMLAISGTWAHAEGTGQRAENFRLRRQVRELKEENKQLKVHIDLLQKVLQGQPASPRPDEQIETELDKPVHRRLLKQALTEDERAAIAKYDEQIREEQKKGREVQEEYKELLDEDDFYYTPPKRNDDVGSIDQADFTTTIPSLEERVSWQDFLHTSARQVQDSHSVLQERLENAIDRLVELRFRLAKQLAAYAQVGDCLAQLKKLETVRVARVKCHPKRAVSPGSGRPLKIHLFFSLEKKHEGNRRFAEDCSECAVALIENSRGPGVTDAVTQICKLCGSEAMSALNIKCQAAACTTAAIDTQDNTRKLEQLKFAVKLYDVILAKDPNAGYARDRIHALRKQIEDLADRGDNAPRIDPFSAP